jgi:hypothetical protein
MFYFIGHIIARYVFFYVIDTMRTAKCSLYD